MSVNIDNTAKQKLNSILCSIPVETPGGKLRRKRSEGPSPIMPKIAITSLNNWTKKNNFKECKFYDIDMLYPNDGEVEKFFRQNKSDIVGLSAVVSTSYLQVKRISKIIRKVDPETLIVCGGYLTAASDTVLRKTDVDICVVGDGEIAWTGLLNYCLNTKRSNKKIRPDELLKVNGIALIDNDNNLQFSGYGHTLSSCHMSFPSFDYLKSGLLGDDKAVMNYFRHFTAAEEFVMDDRSFEKWRKPMYSSIHVSKGCVAKCTFCQRGAKGYSTYELKDLEKHLEQLKKYDVGFLQVDDENFGSNKKYTYEVAQLFHKHNMLWQCSGVRCTSVKKEDLKFYKDHGCVSLKFGIESGSQTMLDIMEKRFTVDDIKAALFNCYDLGLYSPPLGFMVGMPGETLKTAKDSGRLLGQIAAKLRLPLKTLFGYTDIFYAIPLVGTPLYEYGKKLGLVGNNVDEEEAYLKLVSNIGAYKRYYINFNGAPMSEVVFWDILVFLEANKTYLELMKEKTVDQKMLKKILMLNSTQKVNPHIAMKDVEKYKKEAEAVKGDAKLFGGGGGDEQTHVFDKNFVTNFLKKNIVFNEKYAKWVPRFILYPIVRYSLFFEYLIQKYLVKDTNNIHMVTNAKVNKKIRIEEKYTDPKITTQIERSLRTIVEKKFTNAKADRVNNPVDALIGGP
jgi:anaerobic magnesium-protoporphyrin IX monomethyl ester cyclase